MSPFIRFHVIAMQVVQFKINASVLSYQIPLYSNFNIYYFTCIYFNIDYISITTICVLNFKTASRDNTKIQIQKNITAKTVSEYSAAPFLHTHNLLVMLLKYSYIEYRLFLYNLFASKWILNLYISNIYITWNVNRTGLFIVSLHLKN